MTNQALLAALHSYFNRGELPTSDASEQWKPTIPAAWWSDRPDDPRTPIAETDTTPTGYLWEWDDVLR